MRVVVHLSDLHFGRIDQPLIEPLVCVIKAASPHLVTVSGDLTQRARSEQFEQARAFLDRLPFPRLVVPGNHDISLHNLFDRFIRPLRKYCQHITSDLMPFHFDGEIAVLGLNTARSFTTKYGRINSTQMGAVAERFEPLGREITKILVTHHPFDLPPGYDDQDQLVGRAERSMNVLAKSGVDLILSGHLHLAHTGLTAKRYKIEGHSALVVQAGTATSTRGRGEANSFNILRVEAERITVERILWHAQSASFQLASSLTYCRGLEGWRPVEEARPTDEMPDIVSEGAVPRA
jgi:3',5'-cyclic AMP phosphodiesterase CpdA